MTSDHMSNAVGFQRSQRGILTVLLLRRLRRQTPGPGGNKEFTPWGQNQSRGFCQNFAQPSQVVRGDAATPEATEGLPQPGLATTAGPALVLRPKMQSGRIS